MWFHGDVAAGNLLIGGDGRLAAVIDFGLCGVGDPACDLTIAWTMFDRPTRARKALITMASPNSGSADAAHAAHSLRELSTGR